MKRIRIIALSLFFALILSMAPTFSALAAYTPPYGTIKVGLNSSLRSARPKVPYVTLSNESGFNIGTYDSGRNFTSLHSTSAATLTVTARGGAVEVKDAGTSEGIYSKSDSLAIVPKSAGYYGTSYTLPNDDYGASLAYYGGFEFLCERDSDTMSVVNYVGIEDYVKCVVPYESIPSWHSEALKVQALCARTYAVYKIDGYAQYGFDICNTTYSQVYKGVYTAGGEAIKNKVDAAVDDTAGTYILYNGSPINAVYHAASGGATENSENVWTSSVDYLKGVSDPYEKTPSLYSFNGTYTAGEFYQKMKAKNADFNLVNIANISCAYTSMGNIYSVTFTDSNGTTKTYPHATVQSAVLGAFTGYTSRRFSITSGGSAFALETKPVDAGEDALSFDTGDYGEARVTPAQLEELVSQIEEEQGTETKPAAETDPGDQTSDFSENASPVQASAVTYTISSKGYGHNVGMSQYGAKGMAEAGFTYREIIGHYYTGVTLSGDAIPFLDVDQRAWYYDAVAYSYEHSLFQGTSENKFSPDDPMTRGQFVTVLGRISGIDSSAYPGKTFSDVSAGAYYAGYVEWAVSLGIIQGYGNNLFGPEDNLTREQMCAILDNYCQATGITLSENVDPIEFTDRTRISSWAANAVTRLQRAGIISGFLDGSFGPAKDCTRAEVANMLTSFHRSYIA